MQSTFRLVSRTTFCVWLTLLLFLLNCGSRRTVRNEFASRKEIHLIERLAYAEKITNSEVILFGTPHAKQYLVSGWSDPEKDHNTPFQWAVNSKPVFIFHVTERRPYYLHLKMKSFFPNTGEVYVNQRRAGKFDVWDEAEITTIRLSEQLVHNSSNEVELRFNELRSPDEAQDSRRLAAAVYFAIVSPSKYPGEGPAPTQGSYWSADRLTIGGKRVPALDVQTGTSFRFYEKLNPGSMFNFGTFYDPSQLSENDDYAAFRITVKTDQKPEGKEIFYKRVTEKTSAYQHVPLPGDLKADPDTLYQIELEIDRNSSFTSSRTAWLNPTISQKPVYSEPPAISEATIQSLRQQNRDANVIIILLDAAAGTHFGCYGYKRNTTPFTDALAKENFQFNRSYTQAVYTLASTASLMSGMYPHHHRITNRKSRLPSETYTMGEAFQEAGYQTGTFVANGNASGIFGMTQGFHKINEVFRDESYTGWGQDVTKQFNRWVDSDPNRKFFAYLHYREPHAPFNPPADWIHKFVDPKYAGVKEASYELRQQINMGKVSATQGDRDYITALYDANLAYADFQVGEIIRNLKRNGIYDRTIIIVTSDHGEAFWEHNFQGHNSQLYEESIRIPLVIKLANPGHGKRIDHPVRTIDLYPMLTDLLGFSRKKFHADGKSFLPYFASAPADGREVVTHTLGERTYSYLDDRYKYIYSPIYHTEELYNLKEDPLEKNDRIKSEPVRAAYYRSRLVAQIASRKTTRRQKLEHVVIDESTRDNLKALGYIDE